MSGLTVASGISRRAGSNGAFGPPFAANDSSVLLDLCSTADSGYIVGVSTRWSQYATKGFFFQGSGAAVDDVTGLTPGTAGWLQNNSFNLTPSPSGTVYIKVSRTAIAISNAYYASIGNTIGFADSYGVTASDDGRGLFKLIDQEAVVTIAGLFSAALMQVFTTGAASFFPGNGNPPTYVAAASRAAMISLVSSKYGPDATWAEVWFTWSAGDWWMWVDGLCVSAGQFSPQHIGKLTTTTSPLYHYVEIGNFSGFGGPFGPYPIRRFQISNAFCAPNPLPVTIGFYGDSFTRAMDISADPPGTPPTYAQCRTGSNNTIGIGYGAGAPSSVGAINSLQRMAFNNLGVHFRYVNSCHQGKNFTPTNSAGTEGTAAGPGIDDFLVPYTGALDLLCNTPSTYSGNNSGFACDYVFAIGSVNDLTGQYPQTPVANYIRLFNAMADRNKVLKGIVFIEHTPLWGYPANAIASPNWITQGGLPDTVWTNCYNAFIAIIRGGLEVLRTVGTTNIVPFRYVRSKELMNADPNKLNYSTAANPNNLTLSAYLGPNQDNHPSPSGQIWYAEQMWPHLARMLKGYF